MEQDQQRFLTLRRSTLKTLSDEDLDAAYRSAKRLASLGDESGLDVMLDAANEILRRRQSGRGKEVQ